MMGKVEIVTYEYPENLSELNTASEERKKELMEEAGYI